MFPVSGARSDLLEYAEPDSVKVPLTPDPVKDPEPATDIK